MSLTQVFGLAVAFHTLYALGITAGSHRLWAHKSYHASAPLRFFLMLCNSGTSSTTQAPTKAPSTTGPVTTACTTSTRIPVSTPMTSLAGSSSHIWDGCSPRNLNSSCVRERRWTWRTWRLTGWSCCRKNSAGSSSSSCAGSSQVPSFLCRLLLLSCNRRRLHLQFLPSQYSIHHQPPLDLVRELRLPHVRLPSLEQEHPACWQSLGGSVDLRRGVPQLASRVSCWLEGLQGSLVHAQPDCKVFGALLILQTLQAEGMIMVSTYSAHQGGRREWGVGGKV